MSIIELENLTKNYGKSRGISEVTLEVEKGEIYGFIGPNGAGKSTAIKVMLNFLFKTSGEGHIMSLDIENEAELIKDRLGYVPSEVNFYKNLNGNNLINSAQAFHKVKNTEWVDELCDRLQVDRKKKIKELSLGNRKKIAIVCALASKPTVIVLDEPTSGLDPLVQHTLFEILREMCEAGSTVFLSSHNLGEVEAYCDRFAFIREGQITHIQRVADLKLNGKKVLLEGNRDYLESLDFSLFDKSEWTKDGLRLDYHGSTQDLLGFLAGLNLTDVSISNITLEEEFMSLYGRGEEK